MVTLDDVKAALELPVTGSDREVAEAMAAHGGFDRPSEEVTVQYLVTVLDSLVATIASQPEEHPRDDASLAHYAMGYHELRSFYAYEARERVVANDLGIPEYRGVEDVQVYLCKAVVKLRGLIKMVPHP